MNLPKEKFDSFVKKLLAKGYHKVKGPYKNEDFGYWKSFHVTYDDPENSDTKRIGYQIAILIYDWTKYSDHPLGGYGIQFEFMLGNNKYVDRLDLTASDDRMTVEQFEELCEAFYQKIYEEFIYTYYKEKEDY